MRTYNSPKNSRAFHAIWLLAFSLLLALPTSSKAHDIPEDVTVRSFIKPDGRVLQLLVRVPLAAMRDLDVPTDAMGYLDLTRARPVLEDAAILWIADYVQIFEEGEPLDSPRIARARVSLPTDRSFESYRTAMEHLDGPPLDRETTLFWAQGMLDVLFEYGIGSDESRFRINPGLERLGIRVINRLTFVTADELERTFSFPGNPGLISLDPRWHEVASRFVVLGFFHILEGIDHLLFLFCLIIPFRQFRPLVALITAFTIAHSVTLIASQFGFAPSALWFPPLVETLIALSIVYMAFENIAGAQLKRRWLLTFAFGLIHGFGFAFILTETLQFAGTHLWTSLLAFNIGVELGQLLVLVLMIPILNAVFRYVVGERLGTIYLSALITHSAWHWMVDRFELLRQFAWPQLDAAALAGLLRGLMLVVVFAGGIWLFSLFRKPATSTEIPPK